MYKNHAHRYIVYILFMNFDSVWVEHYPVTLTVDFKPITIYMYILRYILVKLGQQIGGILLGWA